VDSFPCEEVGQTLRIVGLVMVELLVAFFDGGRKGHLDTILLNIPAWYLATFYLLGYSAAMFERTAKETGDRRDAMQELTNQFIQHFELGVKPWVKPWDSSKCQGPQAPFNPTTNAAYHGINVLILGCNPLSFQTGDPRFCSYQPAATKGWQVRRGEKNTIVFFTKQYSVKDKRAEDEDAGQTGPYPQALFGIPPQPDRQRTTIRPTED
jgi:hypothetical protein